MFSAGNADPPEEPEPDELGVVAVVVALAAVPCELVAFAMAAPPTASAPTPSTAASDLVSRFDICTFLSVVRAHPGSRRPGSGRALRKSLGAPGNAPRAGGVVRHPLLNAHL